MLNFWLLQQKYFWL